MQRSFRNLFVFASLLVATPMLAQDISRGSIAGIVRDATGAVVPGAKVTLTSPFGDRTTTTGSAGDYLFPNLVAGAGYGVSVVQTGFGVSKIPDLRVFANQRTTADVTLQVSGSVQTVEVTATGTEAVDLASTTVGATISSSTFGNVPIGRNISSVIQMAPGVTDSGGAGAANPSINGASGLENQIIVNGANVTDPGFGGFGTYSRVFGSLGSGVNFDFIQEVQVKSGGFEAQYGQALGGVVNVVTKSGGNKYHGSLYGYFLPHALENARPDANQVNQSQRVYVSGAGSYDFGGDLGGYIVKDRLFWYAGFNPQFKRDYIQSPSVFANSSLGEYAVKTRTLNYQAKVNFNLSSNHQLEGSVFGDPSTRPAGFSRLTAIANNDDSRMSGLDFGSRTWTGRYNGVFSRSWVVSANYSNYFNSLTEAPKFNTYQILDRIPTQEGTGSTITRNGLGFTENSESRTHQVNLVSSNIGNFLGSHSLDWGYRFEDVNWDGGRVYTGPDFQIPNLPIFGSSAGKMQHGAQLIRTHEIPGDLSSPIVLQVTRGDYSNPFVSTTTRYHAAFIQDSWTLGGRLTIRPGVRWEQQRMAGNALHYTFAGNWAPRMGIIFDPTGGRKSKFFANWGRFFERIPQDIALRSFSFESSARGAWYRDQTGANIDLSPANYIPGGKIGLSGGPEDTTIVAGGTKAQYQDEVVGGYEHEFRSGLTFTGRFVYRNLRRVLEDVSGINVTQYLAGVPQQYVVANPSASLDIFTNAFPCTGGPNCDLSTGFTAITNPLGSDKIPDGFPNPSRIYKSMELTLEKRMSTSWQVLASYRLSKLYGNYEGLFRNDNGQSDPNITSLFDFTNTDGLLADQFQPGVLPNDRRHQIKLFSSYNLPAGRFSGFNFGFSWNIQSGTPISKFLAHPAYDNSGEIPSGGRGALGRTDWTFPVDARGEYRVKMGESRSLEFIADVFNLFNQKRVIRVDQNFQLDSTTANPDFLHPNTVDFQYPYQTPRAFRLAARFNF